jgi:hypothetical protein
MSMARMLRLLLVVAFAMACSSDTVSAPLRGFVYSAAAFQCGPADGPAVAIYLAPNPVGSIEPSPPFVRVYVPVQVDQLTSHVWPISSANTEAAAWFHRDGSTYELAETGYMIVTSVESDKTVSGSVDLRFPDSGHIRSVFRATWVPRDLICG